MQYRVLRCAAEPFDEVFVLGTSEALQLRRSAKCKGFFHAVTGFQEPDPCLISQINKICREHQIDLVLPSCSETTRFVAVCGRDFASPHYPVPSREAFDKLDDKAAFARLCCRLGVPTPATHLFNTRAELIAACRAGRISFPCVLKPLRMWGSIGVAKAERPEDIEPKGYAPVLVQDYVPGQEVCAFYLCSDGVITASLAYERTKSGVTFVPAREIDEAAAIIVSHLRCSGTVGFDVRRTPGGRWLFVECNPRFWYRMELAAIAGLNFVALGATAEASRCERIPSGTTIRSAKNLAATLLTPWRLSRYDLSLLRYVVTDPLPNLIVAAQKTRGKDCLASGRQLIFPLQILLGY